MKLLIVSNLLQPLDVGGYERQCFDLATGLVALGHQVHVLTTDRKRGAARPAELPAREVVGRVEIRRTLPWHFDGRATRYMRAAGMSARCESAVRSALEELRPDLIYCWNASGIPSVWLQVARDYDIPVAFYVAEHWFFGLNRHDPFMRYLFRWEPSWSHRCIGVAVRGTSFSSVRRNSPPARLAVSVAWCSAFMSRHVRPQASWGLRIAESRVIQPVSPARDTYAAVRRGAPRANFMFVGRLVPHKGLAIALHALHKVVHLGPSSTRGATLDVFGAGPSRYLRTMRALAESLQIQDRVHWHGATPAEGIARDAATAAAVVIPSTWHEPYGLVCAEAAAAGVPVIASSSGALPEILVPDVEGLFFDIGDADGLAAHMQSVLLDPSAAASRAERARERVLRWDDTAYFAAQCNFIEKAASMASCE